MASEQMWAIVGAHGLYTGTWLRKVEAIASHVSDIGYFDLDGEVHRWPLGGKLDPDQAKIWRRCKRAGDRAVKVTVTWT